MCQYISCIFLDIMIGLIYIHFLINNISNMHALTAFMYDFYKMYS